MAVKRWIFRDYSVPEEWTVDISPVDMGSPFGERNITIRSTSAKNGQALLFEGVRVPPTWEFSGSILDEAHYAELLRWSQKPNRIEIEDHFGRKVEGIIQSFTPRPQRSPSLYFKHEYSMTVLVTAGPTAPTKTVYGDEPVPPEEL
jgi:hypothetical protein